MSRPRFVTLRLTKPRMKGELVRNVQKRLFGVKVDGVYGRETSAAVQDWQWRVGSPNYLGAITPKELLVLLGYRPRSKEWKNNTSERLIKRGKFHPIPEDVKVAVPPPTDKPPRVFTREQIGLRPARSRSRSPHTEGQILTVHYIGPGKGAGPNIEEEKAQFRSFQRYHMDNLGWSDIGYHYGIGRSGALYFLRGPDVYGAHSGVTRANSQPGVVVLTGTGQDSKFTDAQIATLSWLKKHLRSSKFMGHQEWLATSCPGNPLMTWIKKNR